VSLRSSGPWLHAAKASAARGGLGLSAEYPPVFVIGLYRGLDVGLGLAEPAELKMREGAERRVPLELNQRAGAHSVSECLVEGRESARQTPAAEQTQRSPRMRPRIGVLGE
jgi:hypothetical protein